MLTLNLKLWLYGGLAALLIGTVLHFYNIEKNSISDKFGAAQTKVAAEAKKADEVAVNKIETKYQTITKVDIQYVDRIVIKKVIEYRDRVHGRCLLHPEWVRTYNLSTEQVRAESAASEPNDQAEAAGKTVDDAVALDVVTTNNRSCVETRAQLEAFQEWALIPLKQAEEK
jgi:hypothetical protein